jgi:tRNA 2-selenouridine synthase
MLRRVQLPIDPASFDEMIDVRSPGEFALDHMPGAINLPVLDDQQRARIGTLFKQDSSFLARRTGAAIICRNIAGLMETHFAGLPPNYRPLVYCWRGGQRSASLATILDAVGWKACVLEGGYRSFRRHVLTATADLPAQLAWRVIQGPTGSGKTRLLHSLAEQGAQVLDLETLAHHRASVLGKLPDQQQPSQRFFETVVWQCLSGFTKDQPVYVEAENRRIGRMHLPDALWTAITGAPVIAVEVDRPARVDFLLRDYTHFLQDPESLVDQLNHLIPFQGHARVEHWRQWIELRNWRELVDSLLEHHYDPRYSKNSPYLEASVHVALPAVTPPHLANAAAKCLAWVPA